MAIESPQQTVLGPKALLAHLRDHPEGRFKSPRDLAQEFELPVEFVEQVLTKSEPRVHPKASSTSLLYSELNALNKRLKRLMDDSARHPTGFVVGTTFLAEIILLLLSLVHGQSLVNLSQQKLAIIYGPGVLIPFFMVCAQMVLFFRRATVRFALYGALAYWVTGGAGLCWLEWFQTKGLPMLQRFDLCVLILTVHLVISLIYATVGSFIALIGEYQKVLRENRRVEKMTRQELLERLFQLQARMEMAKDAPRVKTKRKALSEFVKPRLYWATAIVGFVIKLIYELTLGNHIGEIFSQRHQYNPSALVLLLSGSILVLVYTANFWFGYVAQNVKSAIVVGAIFSIAGFLAKYVAGSLTGHAHGPLVVNQLFTAVGLLASIAVALVAGVIAAIQSKTIADLNIQRNDEATLIAEQLKIQWRLAQDACSTTVVVVDVVKSTQMKEGADPLGVEYSFRRLQQWFEDISVSHGGSVRSTAGDGAVISFPNCHNAFLASTEIQRRMPDFNTNWNRLETPFRVRCGLHVGEVQGDLGKIQFAQVIDIAAHMQKMAPAGGVAATGVVVASLGTTSFVPLAIKCDGHDVFLAMDPNGP